MPLNNVFIGPFEKMNVLNYTSYRHYKKNLTLPSPIEYWFIIIFNISLMCSIFLFINFWYKLMAKFENLFILYGVRYDLSDDIVDLFVWTVIFGFGSSGIRIGWLCTLTTGGRGVRCALYQLIVDLHDVLSIFLFYYLENDLFSFLAASVGVFADESVACLPYRYLWW